MIREMCNCENEHEENFVCHFCLDIAKWKNEILSLFKDEDFYDLNEQIDVISLRVIYFLDEMLEYNFRNERMSEFVHKKAEDALVDLRGLFFMTKLGVANMKGSN